MKRTALVAALLLVWANSALGAIRDTVNVGIREYKEEIGFFQKANRDPGDPHFMFYDDVTGLNFGIGGSVVASANYGFYGSTNGSDFVASDIVLPTDNSNAFGSRVNGSELHVKARGTIRGRQMIAFLRIKGKAGNSLALDQAYLSFAGFSLGLIPSFFTDLESGVMTSGLGNDSQIGMCHTLFGYTTKIGERWTAALALENASVDVSNYDSYFGVQNDNQPMPDIAGHLKYRWKNGHAQLGFLARNLTYWATPEVVHFPTDGKNAHCFGYGLSFSGNYNPWPSLKLTWQVVGGYGIASYMPDLSALHMDLALCPERFDGLGTLKSIPVLGAVAGVQYNWGKNFSASVLYSTARVYRREDASNPSFFKTCGTAIANFFWYMSDSSYIGVEALYGSKNQYEFFGTSGIKGDAARINAVIAFMF